MTNEYFDDATEDDGRVFYDNFKSLKDGAYEMIEDRLREGLDLERCHILVKIHSSLNEKWGCLDEVDSIDMVPYGAFELTSVDVLMDKQESIAVVEYKFKKSDLYGAIYERDMEY